ncbi:hypothetical protein B0G75_116162 [Paraburkholderia sp. BL18I3N2]|nr:hypothetical protein [Paraburkholderia sp. BL18I3N2]PRX27132.1 hypothetical protein B0G75_116162 [Paraburkholderia sp. BL18I3N2]
MAEQDWMMAGVYLVGLVSMALLMSALATRATVERKAAVKVSSRARD